MRFCTECGKELKENEVFCTACGTKNEQIEIQKEAPVTPTPTPPLGKRVEKDSKPVEKQPMKKSTKWMLGIGGAIAVLLIGTHLFLTSYYDPMKTIQAMDDAILANDVETFVSYIDFEENAILDEDNYFEYIKSMEWDSVKEQYIETLEQNQDSNLKLSSSIDSAVTGERLFNLRQNSKLFLYDIYEFQAVPTELLLSTNIEGTDVTVGETTVTLEDTEPVSIGSVYPGTHLVKAEAETVYGSFAEETDLEVMPNETHELTINFDGITHTFTTNQETAYLFVNGEDTGWTFAELNEIGPIPYETEVELHGEWENSNGEIVKTEVLTMDDYGWYGFEFYFDETESVEVASEEIEEEEDSEETNSGDVNPDRVGEVVLDFRDAYEVSLNNKDFNQIASYLENGSTVYKELEEYVGDLEDTAYHYDFTSNTVLDVEEVDSETFIVTTNELFTFTNHLDEEVDYDRTKEYTVISSGDGYKITNIDYVETNRDY